MVVIGLLLVAVLVALMGQQFSMETVGRNPPKG